MRTVKIEVIIVSLREAGNQGAKVMWNNELLEGVKTQFPPRPAGGKKGKVLEAIYTMLWKR